MLKDGGSALAKGAKSAATTSLMKDVSPYADDTTFANRAASFRFFRARSTTKKLRSGALGAAIYL